MDPALIWILVGLLALGAELALPGVYLVWVGLAALVTGLMILAWDPGFAAEVGLFLLLLGTGVLASLRFKKQVEGKAHRINAPEAGLVGRHATLIAGDPTGLRVRIGDSDWSARLPRDATLPAPGAALVVEAVDGTTLVVRPM
jgi:membrane protein implicated in regulation of membrane protease activity